MQTAFVELNYCAGRLQPLRSTCQPQRGTALHRLMPRPAAAPGSSFAAARGYRL